MSHPKLEEYIKTLELKVDDLREKIKQVDHEIVNENKKYVSKKSGIQQQAKSEVENVKVQELGFKVSSSSDLKPGDEMIWDVLKQMYKL